MLSLTYLRLFVDPRPIPLRGLYGVALMASVMMLWASRADAQSAGSPQPEGSMAPLALWDPAPACNYTALTSWKDTVIIHMTEAPATSFRAWMDLCQAEESVHYLVTLSGEVWQMVEEDYLAWHAACYNARSIGIYHEGYSSDPSHPQVLYESSAGLVAEVCQRWGIPVEHSLMGPGIVAHSDITACCCGTGGDPGAGWDWDTYLRLVSGVVPPGIVGAASRRTHGDAGTFDVDPLTQEGIECRHGGPMLVEVTFDREVVAQGGPDPADVTASHGQVASVAVSAATVTVSLLNVSNAVGLYLEFPGIQGPEGTGVEDTLCLSVLTGDVTGDTTVNIFDLLSVRNALAQPVNETTFRADLDADGYLTVFDLLAVRNALTSAVASPCPMHLP